MLFELLPQCWCSEGVSLSKSMCWPFKRHVWDSPNPLSRHPESLPVFTTEVVDACVSGTGPWSGGQSVRPRHHPPQGGISTAEMSFLIFICHTWVWDKSLQRLHHNYPYRCGFFHSVIVEDFCSVRFQVVLKMVVCSIIVILMWSWGNENTAFTYRAISTGGQHTFEMLISRC